jgi:hemolysin D
MVPQSNPVSPTIRVTAWTIISLFLVVLTGSFLATIEIVARGTGRIIPSGRVQNIQPLTDGKIGEILVAEGITVKAGDVLIRQDTAAAESAIKKIEADIERYERDAQVARAIVAPLIKSGLSAEKIPDQSDETVAGGDILVQTVLSALRDQVLQIDAQIDRINKSRIAQEGRLTQAKADLEIVQATYEASGALRRQGSISEFDYRTRQRELKGSEGDVIVAEGRLDELDGEEAVLVRQKASLFSTTQSTYRKQLNDAEIGLQTSNAELKAAQIQLEGLTIKSPIDGKVEKLSVHTVGGFVEAGENLMTIVPSDGKIEIEAFFENRDVGFIALGQQAFIKFDAFPPERFGMVFGRVANVGADAREGVEGKWVYAVRIGLDQSKIVSSGRELAFVPGMTATIDVVTGERRLISYFFEPIVKVMQDSFGER